MIRNSVVCCLVVAVFCAIPANASAFGFEEGFGFGGPNYGGGPAMDGAAAMDRVKNLTRGVVEWFNRTRGAAAAGDWFNPGHGAAEDMHNEDDGEDDDRFGDEKAYGMHGMFNLDGDDFNNTMFERGSNFFHPNSNESKWMEFFLTHGGKKNNSREAKEVTRALHGFMKAQMEEQRAAHHLFRTVLTCFHHRVDEESETMAHNRTGMEGNFRMLKPAQNFANNVKPGASAAGASKTAAGGK